MARIQKILVAYDGSPHSKEALDWAVDLGLSAKAQVLVVKVVEMISLGAMNALYEEGSKGDMGSLYEEGSTSALSAMVAQIEELSKADQKLLEEAIAKVGQSKGVSITTALLHGNVAAAIIDFAKENGVDLIVAGTKGHGVLEGLLMGSVSRSLVSLSKIPVLIVKD